MKQHDPLKVVNALMNSAQNGSIEKNERCCGESGTLALTPARRLDAGALSQGAGGARRRRGDPRRAAISGAVKVLTSCPSCLQGLARYQRRCRPRSGLHRGRNRPASARRRLDGRVRAPRELGRHRARPRLGARAPPQKDDTAREREERELIQLASAAGIGRGGDRERHARRRRVARCIRAVHAVDERAQNVRRDGEGGARSLNTCPAGLSGVCVPRCGAAGGAG